MTFETDSKCYMFNSSAALTVASVGNIRVNGLELKSKVS